MSANETQTPIVLHKQLHRDIHQWLTCYNQERSVFYIGTGTRCTLHSTPVSITFSVFLRNMTRRLQKKEDMHVHNQTGSYHQKSDDRPCSYFAAESWNSLPSGIRFAKTLATFKSQQSPTFSSSTSLINNPNNCTIF